MSCEVVRPVGGLIPEVMFTSGILAMKHHEPTEG